MLNKKTKIMRKIKREIRDLKEDVDYLMNRCLSDKTDYVPLFTDKIYEPSPSLKKRIEKIEKKLDIKIKKIIPWNYK